MSCNIYCMLDTCDKSMHSKYWQLTIVLYWHAQKKGSGYFCCRCVLGYDINVSRGSIINQALWQQRKFNIARQLVYWPWSQSGSCASHSFNGFPIKDYMNCIQRVDWNIKIDMFNANGCGTCAERVIYICACAALLIIAETFHKMVLLANVRLPNPYKFRKN